MKRKVILFLNIIRYSPLIIFRYCKYLLFKRKVSVHEFRPSSSYCIEGTLNQLIWNVENSIFNILDNSSKVFLDSGELIFQVSKHKTSFLIKSYGYNNQIDSRAIIQVVSLSKVSFDSKYLMPQKKCFKTPNLIINNKNNLLIGIKKIDAINDLRVKTIKISNKPNFNNLKKDLIQINNIQTIEKLNTHNYE